MNVFHGPTSAYKGTRTVSLHVLLGSALLPESVFPVEILDDAILPEFRAVEVAMRYTEAQSFSVEENAAGAGKHIAAQKTPQEQAILTIGLNNSLRGSVRPAQIGRRARLAASVGYSPLFLLRFTFALPVSPVLCKLKSVNVRHGSGELGALVQTLGNADV